MPRSLRARFPTTFDRLFIITLCCHPVCPAGSLWLVYGIAISDLFIAVSCGVKGAAHLTRSSCADD